MWSATISAGGRPADGMAAQIFSAAARDTAKARSLAPRSAGSAPIGCGFEHRRVKRRLVAGEFEIGLAEPVQRGERVRRPSSQARASAASNCSKPRSATSPSARRGRGNAVGRRRADAGETRGLGEGEAGRPCLAISSSAARISASRKFP